MSEQQELKQTIEALHKGFNEFKETHQRELDEIKAGGALGDTKEKMERIETSLQSIEEKQSELEAKLTRPVRSADEVKYEAHKAYGKLNQDELREIEAHADAVKNFLRFGEKRISDDERKLIHNPPKRLKDMVASDDTGGGVLAPIEFDPMIIEGTMTQVSNVRAIADVRSSTARTVQVKVRDTIPTGYWVGENETATESEGTYSDEELTAQKLMVTVDVSREDLEDSAWNLEQLLQSDVAEVFAKTEGTAFVNGNGVKRPEGFLQAGSITPYAMTNSTSGSIDDADDIIDVFGQLKEEYDPNATWVMRKATMVAIRKIKDGQGQYLWQPGIAGVAPNTILNAPYMLMSDMPAISGGAKAVAYGDFRMGYKIIDRLGLSVVRDDVTLAREDKVRFTWRKRLNAQVVLPEAIIVSTVVA